jgi:hypothetical protein
MFLELVVLQQVPSRKFWMSINLELKLGLGVDAQDMRKSFHNTGIDLPCFIIFYQVRLDAFDGITALLWLLDVVVLVKQKCGSLAGANSLLRPGVLSMNR